MPNQISTINLLYPWLSTIIRRRTIIRQSLSLSSTVRLSTSRAESCRITTPRPPLKMAFSSDDLQRFCSHAKKCVFKICMSEKGGGLGKNIAVRGNKGSCFMFTSTGLFLTNAHIFPRSFDGLRGFELWQEDPEPGKYTKCIGVYQPSSLICRDDAADLAMLKFPLEGEFLELGDAREVSELEPVTVVGYPGDCFITVFTSGRISCIGERVYTEGGQLVLRNRMDAAIYPGNSGGPVFYKNSVIGVVANSVKMEVNQPQLSHQLLNRVSLQNVTTWQSEQNSSLFIPIHEVISFLRKNLPEMPSDVSEQCLKICEEWEKK